MADWGADPLAGTTPATNHSGTALWLNCGSRESSWPWHPWHCLWQCGRPALQVGVADFGVLIADLRVGCLVCIVYRVVLMKGGVTSGKMIVFWLFSWVVWCGSLESGFALRPGLV